MEDIILTSDLVLDPFAGWCWPTLITNSPEMWIKSYALLAASYLTDPVCKVREYSWQLELSNQMQPAATMTEWVKTKLFLHLGRIACGVVAIPLAFSGIITRFLTIYFQHEPYIHLKGADPAKTLQGNQFSLYSGNRANLAGGYGITNGGVAPWTYRIDAQIKEIREQNADVICLSELFDPSASFYMYEELKKLGYTDFYFNMGFKTIALGSGLFVASKYAIHNPKFTSFPQTTLQGPTKWACKGFFRFDIASGDDTVARIYTTHLQHSEEPEQPKRNPKITNITQDVIERALTEDCMDDVISRAAQMHLILSDMFTDPLAKPVVLTGDLNLDDAEKTQSSWDPLFDQGTLHYEDKKTWGGDQFCTQLVNGTSGTAKFSQPLNLDYALLRKGSKATIETWLVDANFDGTKFKFDALSDHNGLNSIITLNH